ncbi:hypothetical protein FNV43_RR17593 [Rhamnella rubrinervis]|uniref:Uncharacterized protein n=1 Tax=Rhamnella rubrinervis TaxID=2594499 RepID=A0A8K0GVI5_9ROSA|nr:hypothetical protein FNV43_RR17593 [Rhamnella rubrinervis]
MIKAVKKLKFWSRKKRKKKTHQPYHHPLPPPPSHCCCSCYSSTQPSAPPLPPSWFVSDINHESPLEPGFPEPSYPTQTQQIYQEIVSETSQILPERTTSYQQYMVPNPVYGVPVAQTAARRERSAGVFGCVVDFGIQLMRCFFPCYRIQEVG